MIPAVSTPVIASTWLSVVMSWLPFSVSAGEQQRDAEQDQHGGGEVDAEGDGPGAAMAQHDQGVAERYEDDGQHEPGLGAPRRRRAGPGPPERRSRRAVP